MKFSTIPKFWTAPSEFAGFPRWTEKFSTLSTGFSTVFMLTSEITKGITPDSHRNPAGKLHNLPQKGQKYQ
jgi:hypothetical protein